MPLADVASERASIASIVQYGSDVWIDCAEILNDDCFSDHVNFCVYSCLKHIFKQNSGAVVDVASIMAAAGDIGLQAELEGETKYIKALFNFNVDQSNARGFAVKIRKLSETRSLVGILDSTQEKLKQVTGNESISEITTLAEQGIFDFCTKLTTGNEGVQQIGSGIDEYLQHLEENKDDLGGVDVGFPLWQQQIGGLHSGVHVVGARKKVGKSFFSLNAALYAAIHKTKCLFVDTEMRLGSGGYTRFLTRLADGVEQNEIKYAKYLDDEVKRKKVEKAARILKKIPLDYINVTGKDFDEMISIIRRWINKTVGYDSKGRLNKCLVVYDYLKVSESNALKEATEWQVLGFNMTKLHNLCESYGFPTLTAVQMNRDMAIAASDRVSWLAVSYSSLYKRDPAEIVDSPMLGNRRLVVEDARFGESMDDGNFIGFNLDGKLAKFTELKTRNQHNKEQEIAKNDRDDSDE